MKHTPLMQAKFALLVLSLFHIGIIASSNYLVQLPVTILGMHTTWGAFTFPFIFLATDLTVRIFGATLARKIIFVVMLPALVISYLLSVIFFNGEYQGVAGLAEFNTFVARIALASFLAYCLGQLLDISVFNRLRQLRQWWVAPVASTILGNLLDTLIFFFVAFYQSSDAFMAAHWFAIALADYGFKLLISILVFLPFYGVILSKIQKYLINSGRLCDQTKDGMTEVLAR
ncbi:MULTISPECIES: 7-cyano-7-deazaguanine/7-aminomethyl-7-deazaguanine transporter [unclassified Motilimonas]|uniref:7-cyano-7-deazaguanine/7-aminomethyl-7- deazaguanine transporter n=1 Tax=unclassified Motilimonas TaxID=2643697 RepID=UPI001E32AC19|nr:MULTISPECIES: 7-cyano-7-deazaguanine/7-aminomethyl-7-deazaguanine transporter [unclassified Motilimonas]MCE0559175.1 7-cyano-7-deazaguanine/7-aminomethyl-7-deazaguanine transporter [Motilimonas sp. E26]MDO6525205.1 7-cyano-7-deazaguanine/7-aminomethyl-7-deazaguanine transporter [Motilimonas sp. 1_MG-2023]